MSKKMDVFEIFRSQPYLSLVIGGMIFIVGVFISDIPKMIVSQGWPSVRGTILYHKFIGNKFKEYDGDFYTNIEVHIRYEYSVNGIAYTSLVLNSIDTPLNRYPSSYASRYPVGSKVAVYFDPEHPSDAVLEPGFVDIFRAFDVYCYIIFGIGVYFIYLGISRFKEINDRKRFKILMEKYQNE